MKKARLFEGMRNEKRREGETNWSTYGATTFAHKYSGCYHSNTSSTNQSRTLLLLFFVFEYF